MVLLQKRTEKFRTKQLRTNCEKHFSQFTTT